MAIELPQDLKEKIFGLAKEISQGQKAKLVVQENLHLTLVFLGEQSSQEIETIKAGLRQIRGYGEINLCLENQGTFFRPGEGGEFWIKVKSDQDKLIELQKEIVDKLTALGLDLPNKGQKFIPHLTLYRFKGKIEKMPERSVDGGFVVDKITLFVSELTKNGPLYSKMAEFEVK